MQPADLFKQIVPPMLPSTVLHRTNLISSLRQALLCGMQEIPSRSAKKLVLLCAPAGYGKTTLLADFAASAPLPCCWYFLERTDVDVILFLRTLLASLCVAFPQLDEQLSPLFTNQFAHDPSSSSTIYHAAIDALCNTIAREVPERFALFLCNYEQINESETLTNLIDYLLLKLPPQAALVIESRSLPRIYLAELIVRDELFAFDSNALRFSAEEISELAKLHGLTTLTTTDAEHLATSFDGWITGILLGTRLGDLLFLPSMPQPLPHSTISFLRENTIMERKRKNLFTYVAREVFQQDQTLYRFLQPVSILQQMEAEMCNALLEIDNAAELLACLEQQGLFISSYESRKQVIYICHPVIRELLTAHLRQQEPERFLALQRKAAVLWHGSRNEDQAMYHALEVGDYDLAVQFILEVYRQYLRQHRLDTLLAWLQALPSSIKENSPRLLLIEGTVMLARGQHTLAFPLLERASALITESDPSNRSMDAEVHLLRGRALYQAGDISQAQTLYLQTLQAFPEIEDELRAEARMRIGICAILLGDLSSGILTLQEVLYNQHSQLPAHQLADIHGVLVNAYYLTGNFLLAKHHLDRALDYCEYLQDEQGKINNLIRKGILFREQGQYQEAEADLQEALNLARKSVSGHGSETYILANLGFLQLEQGKYIQSLAFYEDALGLAYTSKNLQAIHSILPNISLVHLFLGDASGALTLLNKIETPSVSEEMMSYEQAEQALTYALILLYQQRYNESYSLLVKIEESLRRSGLQQELIIAQLRLAACQFERGQKQEALEWLAEVIRWLEYHTYCTHAVSVQLQWLPSLLQIVKSLPQMARLREILSLELSVQEGTNTLQRVAPSDVLHVSRSKLQIRAFGEPIVLINDQPIEHWRMAHAMELFFYLLDMNALVSKERIITAIWSDFDDRVNQTFHSTIHQLRKLLGKSCIIFHTNGYSLNLAAHYGENIWYDIQEFRAFRAEAHRLLDQGDSAAARAALLRMVELYQGDYGRSFSNDWCSFRRNELCMIYLEARRQLAQIAWQDQAYSESIHHWRCILAIDNCQEEAYYHIMLCYSHQAKRSAALRQYQICKETLQEELGVKPGKAIEDLYHDLRSGVVGLNKMKK